MANVPPKMTYYTKVVDNLTGEQIFGYVSTVKNKTLYYGSVDGLNGGESQYSVFFDIWNNEPGWSGGTPLQIAQDATNCKLRINIPAESRDINPFLYARCTTADLQGPFESLNMGRREFDGIKGNMSKDMGVILGSGDHATIQTKIKLKPGLSICRAQYAFELVFSYNFE